MKFDHLPEFKVTGAESEEYGEAVKETANLLKRPYQQVHVMFTREQWTLEEIKRHYQNATKHNGKLPNDVCWWYLRKKRNAKD